MPAAIGALILGGALAGTTLVTIGGTAITLGYVVGYVVLTGVFVGLSFLMPKPEMPKQEDGSQSIRQARPPAVGAYGRVRLGGAFMLYEEYEGVSFDVLALVRGEIGGFVAYYLNDDEVTPDIDGLIPAGGDDRYSDGVVQIRTRVGLETETAYPEVTDVLPSDIWSTAHRGDGIASLMLRCSPVAVDDFQKIYPHGLPEASTAIDAYKVFDPRDETQARNNTATWQVSYNPVIQLMDFLTHPDHGMNLDYDALIAPVLDSWMDEADLCDALVAKVGGTEPRYRSSGWYTFDTKPENIVGAILGACDGWLAENGDGTLAIKVGVYRAPTDARKTIRWHHILGFDVEYGIPDEERVNELNISYISPEHAYKEVQPEPWRDEDDISETGITRSQALSLSWVQTHSQARRLAKRVMARLKPTLRGSVVTTLYGLAILGERWIRIQFPIVAGLEDAIVEIQKADVDLMSGRVTFEWVKVDPDTIDAWTPATEEGEAPVVPEKIAPSSIPVLEDVTVALEAGALLVTFDDLGSLAGASAFRYRVRYRALGEDAWTVVGPLQSEPDGSPGRLRVNAGAVPIAGDLQSQIAAIAPGGGVGAWAPDPPATTATGGATPGVPTGLSAVDDTGIVTISWTNPNSPTMYAARVYRGATFGAATLVAGPLYGTANQAMSTTNSPGAGTHNYWVTAANAAGDESSPAGPAGVTI